MHISAMNNHCSVIDWLQYKLHPPNIKCRRALHQNGDVSSLTPYYYNYNYL